MTENTEFISDLNSTLVIFCKVILFKKIYLFLHHLLLYAILKSNTLKEESFNIIYKCFE